MLESATQSTPLMKQYWEIKNQHPDQILLFRLGDFYEMFFDDAKTAAPILDIALTSRDKSSAQPVALCGIPYHSAQSYISKLLDQGLTVAICEQIEDPKLAKGIVKRDVVRVITPGLRTDLDGLPSHIVNPLVALYEFEKKIGLAWLEVSTGLMKTAVFVDRESAIDEVKRLKPYEVLQLENTSDELIQSISCKKTSLAAWVIADAHVSLAKRFELASIDGLGLDQANVAAPAAWMLIFYVEKQNKTNLPYLQAPKSYLNSNLLILDVSTQEHLDLFHSAHLSQKDSSLFSILNHTQTMPGMRALREWLSFPTQDTRMLESRLDTLDEMIARSEDSSDLRSMLKLTCDVERVIGRIASKRCLPRDFVSLRETLKLIPNIKSCLATFKSELLDQYLCEMDDHKELLVDLVAAILEQPAPTLKEGGVIQDGFSPELDRLRAIMRGGKTWISELEQKEKKATGITNLKIGYNRVFGYFFEVSKSHIEKVPAHYIRKQTLANGERFITPELKVQEDEILQAEEKIIHLEEKLFEEMRVSVVKNTQSLQSLSRSLANIDVLLSLSHVSRVNQYVRPRIHQNQSIHIEEGRHPVLEHFVPRGDFISNDVQLDHDRNQFMIITGPNMAGKSTVMRQTGLIVLLAHVGCFVPARAAHIPKVDRIFTRVGASDDLASGKSTFMVEMSETASILRNATEASLVLLDEIGRGTSTFDGLSIAWAVTEYLHDLGAKTMFATHYHELTELADLKARVVNKHVAVKEWKGSIVFMRKLIDGAVHRSYGIEVAKLAGVLPSVLSRAKVILKKLETGDLKNKKPQATQAEDLVQLPLFQAQEDNPILHELRLQDLDAVSPLKALELLYDWKKRYLPN